MVAKSLLPHNTLRRIYRQEGIRFRREEEDKVQEQTRQWLLKTAWIGHLYANHIGNKSVSQRDIGRALAIQGISVQAPLQSYKQAGGVCDPNNRRELCYHPPIGGETPIGGENSNSNANQDGQEASGNTCYGGGRRRRSKKKQTTTRRSKRRSICRHKGGMDPTNITIKHVQYNPDSPTDKPECRHSTDGITFNTINRQTYPLHKFENLYNVSDARYNIVEAQAGGGKKVFKNPQVIKASLVKSTLESLPRVKLSSGAITLLQQATDYQIRNIIADIRQKST